MGRWEEERGVVVVQVSAGQGAVGVVQHQGDAAVGSDAVEEGDGDGVGEGEGREWYLSGIRELEASDVREDVSDIRDSMVVRGI